MHPAKAVFLADAGQAEWLAGESPQENIVVGHILFRVRLRDVTPDFVLVREIGFVGLDCVVVPLRSPDAATSPRLKPPAEAADASEEVNEGETGGFAAAGAGTVQLLPQKGKMGLPGCPIPFFQLFTVLGVTPSCVAISAAFLNRRA